MACYLYKILAVRGFIGHFEEGGLIPVPRVERCYLWSSLHFAFTYNNGHIISANVSTAGSHPIALDDLSGGELKIEFSYSGEILQSGKIVLKIFSVEWIETDQPFNEREHLKGKFFPKTLEIHWLSVINSVVLGIWFTLFVSQFGP